MVISAIVIGYAGCALDGRNNNKSNANFAVLVEFRRSVTLVSKRHEGGFTVPVRSQRHVENAVPFVLSTIHSTFIPEVLVTRGTISGWLVGW